MDIDKALNIIKEISNALFEQGTISVSPKNHELLQQAINRIEQELKSLPQAANSLEQEIASDIEKV